MKIRTLSPLLEPGTRKLIPVGTELEVGEQDVFWFRRVQDGAVELVAEPVEAPKAAAPRAERPSTRKE